MDKREVVTAVIEELHRELELYMKAAEAAHAEATHEQSKPENKYDTRGLEASYLARGQSRQAAEIVNAIKQFQSIPLVEWQAGDAIDVGALVELKEKSEPSNYYFVGPAAGGTEIRVGKKKILVITPASPLGQQLMDRKAGGKLKLEIAGTKSEYLIVAVS